MGAADACPEWRLGTGSTTGAEACSAAEVATRSSLGAIITSKGEDGMVTSWSESSSISASLRDFGAVHWQRRQR